MRQFIFAVIAAFALVGPTNASDILPSEPDIERTIQSQIEAFKSDDFSTAFTFASRSIQSIFGSPERFGSMVQNGYPMVWRPTEMKFLELRNEGGRLWQKVMVRDRSGALHVLDYQMIETDQGWRINGVQLLETPDVGA